MADVVNDLDQRRRALSPEHSFIVQAPAGSGKTELLIQRYLLLLALVENPEEIVAITFTRKAAAEMRMRIVNALELARADEQPMDDAARITRQLAQEVLVRDQKYDWQLEINPGRLRIQTIDSLCAWLTRQMPILSRFGAQPETIEDAAELYREAASDVLEELEHGGTASAGIAVLLGHLDNNLPRVRDLLAAMLAKRDHWLRHFGPGVRRENLEAALKHSVETSLTITRKTFPQQHVEEFLECLRFATGNLALETGDTTAVICRELVQLPEAHARDLPLWKMIAEFCLTGNNTWRKRVDRKLGFPPSGEGKQVKGRFQDLLARLCSEDLRQRLIETRELPPVTYTDNEWQVIRALCELLILADARLRVIFSERNSIDFSGITHAAIEALGDEDNPTDLALHLDYRIRHILVDEFQDVSINQFDLLRHLTAGWAPGDGHTLFLVGDPMQSIYRFREAEVSLFMETWEQQQLGQVPVTPVYISVNFRSQAGIVDWVNTTFRQVLPEIPDRARGAVHYAEAQAYHPETGVMPVQIHPFLGTDRNGEAEKVAALVKAEKSNNPDGTIAILVRSRPQLNLIVPHLKARGLRFRAVEIEELGRRPAVQDLLALTEALNHFADRIAWLAILRAPWCGLTLKDLHILAEGTRNMTVWECMQDESRCGRMSNEGLQRLHKLRNVMLIHFKEQRRRSLRRSVESVWMSLGGPATLEDETDLENVASYFELLDQFDEGGELASREEFVKHVERLFAAPDVRADESLQVMTIHKAKGLEFDVVIVPGLAGGKRSDDAQLLLWTELPHGQHQDLLVAPIKEAGDRRSPIYDYLQGLERQRQYFEEGRLLYVAATRARHRLHLLGTVNVRQNQGDMILSVPRSGSLLAQLWPLVHEHFESALEQYQVTPQSEPVTGVGEHRLLRLHPDWVLPEAPAAVAWHLEEDSSGEETTTVEYEWAGVTIRHIGSVVHRYIRRMAEDGIHNWGADRISSGTNLYRRALRQLGVPEWELPAACRSVEEALLRSIHDERGRWILAERVEQGNEFALSAVLNGNIVNVIIDRTFIDDEGTRWIIDYKTSRHEGPDVDRFLNLQVERYRPQLEKYAAIFRNMEERPVRLGLYFPLLQGWREWEYK